MVKEQFDLGFILELFPKLLRAFPATLEMALLSALFGWLFGLLIAFGRVNGPKLFRGVIRVVTVVLRGVPEIVLLYLVYFGLPKLMEDLFGVSLRSWSKMTFIVLALALRVAMTSSEMFRSAYNSMDKGQLEAAHALGMTRWQRFRRIIFPQSAFVILPNLTSASLSLIQATSFAYTLSVLDVMYRARTINANIQSTRSLESYIAVAVIYWAFSFVVIRLFKLLERRLGHGMRTVASAGD